MINYSDSVNNRCLATNAHSPATSKHNKIVIPYHATYTPWHKRLVTEMRFVFTEKNIYEKTNNNNNRCKQPSCCLFAC